MRAVYMSTHSLAAALRRAADAHHKYEQSTGKPDSNWYDWYAEHMSENSAAVPLSYGTNRQPTSPQGMGLPMSGPVPYATPSPPLRPLSRPHPGADIVGRDPS